MFPYFATIILVALFAAGATSNHNKALAQGREMNKLGVLTKGLLVFAVLTLIFTAAFRYDIGTDFQAYYKADEIFSADPWEALKSFSEPGIAFMIRIIKYFFPENKNVAFIAVFSLFTIGLSVPVLLKWNDDYLFTLLLYIFAGCWHGSFNGVRQFLAATFIVLGFRFIFEKEFWKYAIMVFLAFLFHTSAIVMIVPFFVMRNKITIRNILLLAIGTLVVAFNYETVFSFLGLMKSSSALSSSYATNSVNTLRILANAAPAVAAIIINYGKDLTEKETFCINGLIMNAAAMIAASNSTYLARISIYTGYFIPLCLSEAIRMEDKKLEKICRIGIVVLFFIFWYMEVSTYPALKEFKWTWNNIK